MDEQRTSRAQRFANLFRLRLARYIRLYNARTTAGLTMPPVEPPDDPPAEPLQATHLPVLPDGTPPEGPPVLSIIPQSAFPVDGPTGLPVDNTV
jgi:hypothetical protein